MQQLNLFDPKIVPTIKRVQYISPNSEANICDFLELHLTAGNTTFRDKVIIDYQNNDDFKFLKYVLTSNDAAAVNMRPRRMRVLQLITVQYNYLHQRFAQ